MKTVTVCITSFNRFELLQQTIDSFRKLNKFPIERFLVIDDSQNKDMHQKLKDTYSDGSIEFMFNEQNIGQIKSIDKMYATVNTDYIFHSEDDYQYIGNQNFIQDSMDILEENEWINQIWMRHLQNYVISHGENGLKRFESEVLTTSTGVKYRMVKDNNGWCGFSFNPGLRRVSDYKKLFPNGYMEHIKEGHGVLSEFACSKHAAKNGYRAALLVNGACNNMGQHVSTYK